MAQAPQAFSPKPGGPRHRAADTAVQPARGPRWPIAAVIVLLAGVLVGLTARAAAGSGPNVTLPACPFWAAGITPPPRSDTPWTRPLQTAPAVDFSARLAPPVVTGTLSGGQVALTLGRVPGAVAYRVWRDGVAVAWISDYGQPTLTAVDQSPCQGAYYTAVAMVDNNDTDASMGQLSPPYWLGNNGVVAPDAGTAPPGTTITMMVTSYNDVGSTATGLAAQLGVCAVDPRVIPWGTYFTVPDYGTCYAGDIGTWIQNDTVDIWLPGNQANAWGVQHRTVTIIANPHGTPGPTPTATPTTPRPTPTPTPSHSPSPTPTPTPTGGSCGLPAWSASTSYVPGQQVSYAGHGWLATYYSTGAVPNSPASWAVWRDNGPC